jgi:hypothetical protein
MPLSCGEKDDLKLLQVNEKAVPKKNSRCKK